MTPSEPVYRTLNNTHTYFCRYGSFLATGDETVWNKTDLTHRVTGHFRSNNCRECLLWEITLWSNWSSRGRNSGQSYCQLTCTTEVITSTVVCENPVCESVMYLLCMYGWFTIKQGAAMRQDKEKCPRGEECWLLAWTTSVEFSNMQIKGVKMSTHFRHTGIVK